MRPLTPSRCVQYSASLSGVSGDELEGLRWSIEFKVSQSVQGLEDDSMTSIVNVSDS